VASGATMLRNKRNARHAHAGKADAPTRKALLARRRQRRKRAEQALRKLRADIDWLRGDLHAIDSELVERKLDARTAVFEALMEISLFLEKHGISSGVFHWAVSDADLSRKDTPETIVKERLAEMTRRLRWKRTRPLRRKPTKEKLRELRYDLTWLRNDLVAIEREFESGHWTQRWATLCALELMARFFSRQAVSKPVLARLNSVRKSVRRPREKGRPGRKSDSVLVRQLKGRLAAIARLFMESGFSRDEAADRVSRQTPPEVAIQLSSKGFISPRAVKNYMDRYDCGPGLLKKFEHASERKRFETIFKKRPRRRWREEPRFMRQQVKFLMENTPKRLPEKDAPEKNDQTWHALAGLQGFAVQMYLVATARAEGYSFSPDEFLKRLFLDP